METNTNTANQHLEAKHEHTKQMESCSTDIAQSMNKNTNDHTESNHERTLKLEPMQMTQIKQKQPRAQHKHCSATTDTQSAKNTMS